MKRDYKLFLFCIGGCVLLGMLSGLFTRSALVDWYPTLYKPPGTPPSWVFPLVWTLLYAMMGAALALIIRSRSPNSKLAVQLFVAQFAANLSWSFFFFYLRSPLLGLIDLSLLWLLLAATLWGFARVSKTAFFLLIPYFLWVIYAWRLNFLIFCKL